mmetsp:Transcript_12160/g.21786  ORF Transcript_12160/g.21786 Transcript_12160/m.21786 type:complete len:312 (-) Transcript_12160:159-1094(-)
MTVYVEPPEYELQPWARAFLDWLSQHSRGVARIDLKRPTLPPVNYIEGDNILFLRPRDRPSRRDLYDDSPRSSLSLFRSQGARMKLTRSLIFGLPRLSPLSPLSPVSSPSTPSTRSTTSSAPLPHASRRSRRPRAPPLLDTGVGLNLDLDGGRLTPVVRLKILNFFRIAAFPTPHVRLSHRLNLGGLALSARYECPIQNLQTFWMPPARLMLRVDGATGSGIHITPFGIEFDEKIIALGGGRGGRRGGGRGWTGQKNSIKGKEEEEVEEEEPHTWIRAAAAISWPRQLPLDLSSGDALEVKLRQLTLKTLW